MKKVEKSYQPLNNQLLLENTLNNKRGTRWVSFYRFSTIVEKFSTFLQVFYNDFMTITNKKQGFLLYVIIMYYINIPL